MEHVERVSESANEVISKAAYLAWRFHRDGFRFSKKQFDARCMWDDFILSHSEDDRLGN